VDLHDLLDDLRHLHDLLDVLTTTGMGFSMILSTILVGLG
jgi:hypothetical protein